jgi:hypothetical protein
MNMERQNMNPKEINDKVEAMKSYLEELYDEGVIKPREYNDLWSKLTDIKIKKKCEE